MPPKHLSARALYRRECKTCNRAYAVPLKDSVSLCINCDTPTDPVLTFAAPYTNYPDARVCAGCFVIHTIEQRVDTACPDCPSRFYAALDQFDLL